MKGCRGLGPGGTCPPSFRKFSQVYFFVNKFRLCIHKLHMSVGHANFFHVLSSDTLLHLTVDAPTTFASQITTCPPRFSHLPTAMMCVHKCLAVEQTNRQTENNFLVTFYEIIDAPRKCGVGASTVKCRRESRDNTSKRVDVPYRHMQFVHI